MHLRTWLRLCALLPAIGLTVALWVPTPVPAAPDEKEPKSDESSPGFTFRVPVNVVLVNVTVTDRAGKPVKDLTVEDFKLFEDGKRQPIQSFEVESSQLEAGTNLTGEGTAPPTPGAQVAAQEPEDRTRLISYFIDDLTARSPRYFFWVVSALQKFIAEEMGPEDQVGVFSASGRVRMPFTGDRKLLRERIEELHVGKFYLSRPYRSRCPVMTDVQVIRIVDGHRGIDFTRAFREATRCIEVRDLDPGDIEQHVRAEAFHQYSGAQAAIQRLVAALRHHVRTLQHFTASKSVVLFSDGFVPARSMRWRLDQVVSRALRSRVAVNVVDIRGLHTVGFEAANNDQGRNLTGEPISQEDFNAGLDPSREFSSLFRDQTYQRRPLEKLTEETGGILFTDNNDLVAGLSQISNTQSYYYVLSYASPDQKADGKYHKIRVEVDRPTVELSYRRGYFAPRKTLSLEDRKNEDIQLALTAPGNFDQIPLQLAYRSSPTQDDRHRLSVFTNVSIAGMPFRQEGERRQNLLHLLLMVYDRDGQRVEGSQKTIELNLGESSYRSMLQRGFTTRTEWEVPAGEYKCQGGGQRKPPDPDGVPRRDGHPAHTRERRGRSAIPGRLRGCGSSRTHPSRGVRALGIRGTGPGGRRPRSIPARGRPGEQPTGADPAAHAAGRSERRAASQSAGGWGGHDLWGHPDSSSARRPNRPPIPRHFLLYPLQPDVSPGEPGDDGQNSTDRPLGQGQPVSADHLE